MPRFPEQKPYLSVESLGILIVLLCVIAAGFIIWLEFQPDSFPFNNKELQKDLLTSRGATDFRRFIIKLYLLDMSFVVCLAFLVTGNKLASALQQLFLLLTHLAWMIA